MEELGPLVERIRGGDREAYGDLVRRFQDMAAGYAYSLLRALDALPEGDRSIVALFYISKLNLALLRADSHSERTDALLGRWCSRLQENA